MEQFCFRPIVKSQEDRVILQRLVEGRQIKEIAAELDVASWRIHRMLVTMRLRAQAKTMVHLAVLAVRRQEVSL